MRLRTTLALAATAVGGLLLVPAQPAGACSCLNEPVTTHLRDASVAFVGRADATDEEASAVVATFRVERVYKGTPPSRVRVSTARSGTECGVSFVEGRTYAVFALGQAGALTTNLCSGTTDDLSSISGLMPIAQPSETQRAAPRDEPTGATRAAPIAVAGLLVAVLVAASGLAVRASRRPRPIA